MYHIQQKYEVFAKFLHLSNLISTQFGGHIKQFQCDNGREYNNSQFHNYYASNGTIFQLSCSHTSQQNGHFERMIRTINNMMHTLLFHSHFPPAFWPEALHMTTHLFNILPYASISNGTPTISFTTATLYMTIFVFLDAYVFHAFTSLINFNLVPLHASFSWLP